MTHAWGDPNSKISPRGNERFVEPVYFFATPKMWSAIEGIAKVHGVLPTFMIRMILMQYLDLNQQLATNFAWRDDRTQKRTKKVHLSLTVSTRKHLDNLADYHGMNNAQIIRIAIQNYLSRHPLTKPRQVTH